AGVEKDRVRLERKLTETKQKLQTKQKEEIALFRKLGGSEEKIEMKEKGLEEKYSGLTKLLKEAKSKLKGDEYTWLIKIFEAQEELIILEKRDNPRPKTQEVSEAKWKLR